MDLTVDALGDKCPIPVVKAKQALATMDEGTLEILVDNETSVTNLKNFAKSKNCEATSSKLGDAKFSVKIVKEAGSEPEEVVGGGAGIGPRVVVVPSRYMGHGDDELGDVLIKAFIFSLTQQDTLPDSVLFYNDGVKLTIEGSPVLEDIQKLFRIGTRTVIEGQVDVTPVGSVFTLLDHIDGDGARHARQIVETVLNGIDDLIISGNKRVDMSFHRDFFRQITVQVVCGDVTGILIGFPGIHRDRVPA